MEKQILVNATPFETRIALLEDGQLVEVYLESRYHRRTAGNVVKGRVAKVLPGMQAAFVDVGMERNAFLYSLDVIENLEDWERTMLAEEGEDTNSEDQTEGDDERSEDLHGTDNVDAPTPIEELLQTGQEILVQVSKEPLGTKGARVTTHITLPGRYLVLMPGVNHVGVSRRIADPEERARLRSIVESLRPAGCGFIVRTVAEGKGQAEFESDIELLMKVWERIWSNAERAGAPCVVHRDLDPIFRTVRDLFTVDVERLVIDSETEYQRCVEYTDSFVPHLTTRVKLYRKDNNIFDEFGIEDELESLFQPRVWLRSGGYLVIEQTEALVAIDVNTGKYVGKRSLEDTITRINVEAAREIARQIRLRDLGGIIVIDFIDMELEENQERVLETLENALEKDRARYKLSGLTSMGLVQMTRKRVKQSLTRSLGMPCPYCRGTALVRSPSSLCFEIYREVTKVLRDHPEQEILVRVHPEVASLLRKDERELIDDLEATFRAGITIQSDPALHHEQYDIVSM